MQAWEGAGGAGPRGHSWRGPCLGGERPVSRLFPRGRRGPAGRAGGVAPAEGARGRCDGRDAGGAGGRASRCAHQRPRGSPPSPACGATLRQRGGRRGGDKPRPSLIRGPCPARAASYSAGQDRCDVGQPRPPLSPAEPDTPVPATRQATPGACSPRGAFPRACHSPPPSRPRPWVSWARRRGAPASGVPRVAAPASRPAGCPRPAPASAPAGPLGGSVTRASDVSDWSGFV